MIDSEYDCLSHWFTTIHVISMGSVHAIPFSTCLVAFIPHLCHVRVHWYYHFHVDLPLYDFSTMPGIDHLLWDVCLALVSLPFTLFYACLIILCLSCSFPFHSIAHGRFPSASSLPCLASASILLSLTWMDGHPYTYTSSPAMLVFSSHLYLLCLVDLCCSLEH